MKTIYITGGTGFVGRELTQVWLARSDEYHVIVQTRKRIDHSSLWVHPRLRYVNDISELAQDTKIDCLVNLAGAPIADARWTAGRQAVLRESRIGLTRRLVAGVKALTHAPALVISASAIGFYGVGGADVTESFSVGEGFAAELCESWEREALEFSEGSRLVVMRLGVVLGDGGALSKLLPLYRLGLGGPIGAGDQGFSWVHIDDVIGAILYWNSLPEASGVFNLVAPTPLRQREFASTLGRVLGRPSFVPTPSLALRLVFGEMASELLINGQAVIPKALNDSGYVFRYPTLQPALESIV